MSNNQFHPLHLRAEGEYVILSINVNDKWVDLIKERLDSAFSHIIEPLGIETALTRLNNLFPTTAITDKT